MLESLDVLPEEEISGLVIFLLDMEVNLSDYDDICQL